MDNLDMAKLLSDPEFLSSITSNLGKPKPKYSPEVQELLDKQAEELLTRTNSLLLKYINNEVNGSCNFDSEALLALATLRGTLV